MHTALGVDLDAVDFAYRTGDDARMVLPALDLHGAVNKSMAGLGYIPSDFPDATSVTVVIEPETTA